jgi:hypothetical protein
MGRAAVMSPPLLPFAAASGGATAPPPTPVHCAASHIPCSLHLVLPLLKPARRNGVPISRCRGTALPPPRSPPGPSTAAARWQGRPAPEAPEAVAFVPRVGQTAMRFSSFQIFPREHCLSAIAHSRFREQSARVGDAGREEALGDLRAGADEPVAALAAVDQGCAGIVRAPPGVSQRSATYLEGAPMCVGIGRFRRRRLQITGARKRGETGRMSEPQEDSGLD